MMEQIVSERQQEVVYTIMDMETGRKEYITETRPVSEGLREPNIAADLNLRVITARVLRVL